MRKIYVTTRMLEEFELEDSFILLLLKKLYPDDNDIQFANSLEDIGDADEIEETLREIGDVLSAHKEIPRKILGGSILAYSNYSEAYEDMEWGIH